MSFTRTFRLLPDRSGHRLAALTLLVLQAAVAISPLWEPRSEGRLSAHAEQNGARHVVHDDATCALCAARAQASMAMSAPAPLASGPQRSALVPSTSAAAPRVALLTNCSRAPPV